MWRVPCQSLALAEPLSSLAPEQKCGRFSRYLWYWENSFNYFIGNVSGSPTDPAVGNETAFRNQVSNTSYPDGQ